MIRNHIECYENHISSKKCDSLIDIFHKNESILHEDIHRNYTVMHCNIHNFGDAFQQDLWEAMEKYMETYTYLEEMYCSWDLEENFNIQMYHPGKSYGGEHHEHDGSEVGSKRHLAWMIYLNDVNDGGGTYWPQQLVETKARKGSMVIWPASWTHSHYGLVSPTEKKYIVTGWGRTQPANLNICWNLDINKVEVL